MKFEEAFQELLKATVTLIKIVDTVTTVQRFIFTEEYLVYVNKRDVWYQNI